jgi:hypothetical protein
MKLVKYEVKDASIGQHLKDRKRGMKVLRRVSMFETGFSLVHNISGGFSARHVHLVRGIGRRAVLVALMPFYELNNMVEDRTLIIEAARIAVARGWKSCIVCQGSELRPDTDAEQAYLINMDMYLSPYNLVIQRVMRAGTK